MCISFHLKINLLLLNELLYLELLQNMSRIGAVKQEDAPINLVESQKTVFGVCDMDRLNPVYPATETS